MTNETRLEKLRQAENLIREVEFSYPVGHSIRSTLYKFIVDNFSWLGVICGIRDIIESNIDANKRGYPAKGEKQRDCLYSLDEFERCPSCRDSFAFNKPYGQACPSCGVNIIDAYEKSEAV